MIIIIVGGRFRDHWEYLIGPGMRAFGLLMGGLMMSHTVVGSILLDEYSGMSRVCDDVWSYCLAGVLFSCVMAVTFIAVTYWERSLVRDGLIIVGIILYNILFVWTVVLNDNADTEACVQRILVWEFYVFFRITFWFIVGSFSVIVIGIIIGSFHLYYNGDRYHHVSVIGAPE